MNGVLNQILTESDNATHSLYKHLALACIATAIALEIFTVVYKGEPFDMQAFGIGIGALVTGIGAALRMTPEAREVVQ